MLYRKINVELIVIADQAEALVPLVVDVLHRIEVSYRRRDVARHQRCAPCGSGNGFGEVPVVCTAGV
jgi:hypothetical protein